MDFLGKLVGSVLMVMSSILSSIFGLHDPSETTNTPTVSSTTNMQGAYRWVPLEKAISSIFYAKENKVYVKSPGNEAGTVLLYADPRTFTVADAYPLFSGGADPDYSLYAKDFSHVYIVSSEIKGADANTFIVLSQTEEGEGYAKDKFRVYWDGRAVEKADATTFTALGGVGECMDATCTHFYDGQDSQHKYLAGKVVE